MVSRTTTCQQLGTRVALATVEAEILNGFTAFFIVGLAQTSVQESKERIRSALASMDLQWPVGRLIVNLVPGNLPKGGTHWDLPIAVAIFQAMELISPKRAENFGFFGELSLDGTLCGVEGAYAFAEGMRDAGVTNLILPQENVEACKFVPGVSLYGATNVQSVFRFLRGGDVLPCTKGRQGLREERAQVGDYADIRGQNTLKRLMEIAAAGGHAALVIGPPGVGKTMAVRRLPGILPPLTQKEKSEIYRLHSLYGGDSSGSVRRPFRTVHHTITRAALLGGGVPFGFGEVSLAHRGILFFDELLEFPRRTLELLRVPMEKKILQVVRGRQIWDLPCDFQLMAASNPCPCGNYGDEMRACTCSMATVQQYREHLSAAMCDRFDLCLEVRRRDEKKPLPVPEAERQDGNTDAMRRRVESARLRQENRYAGLSFSKNADFPDSGNVNLLNPTAAAKQALTSLERSTALSERALRKILLVARTIADLEDSALGEEEVLEAFYFRRYGLDFRRQNLV